jgi:hypothetical protein
MRARRIIEGAAFGPEVIRVAIEAFETAWTEIADRFDPAEHGAVRGSLATAIISSAREDSRDANLLKEAGLRAMARAYPDQLAAPLPSSDKAKNKGN